MPRHRPVPSLLDLVYKTIEDHMKLLLSHTVSEMKTHKQPLERIRWRVRGLRRLFVLRVPAKQFGKLSVIILKIADELLRQTKKQRIEYQTQKLEIDAIVKFSEVVICRNLKSVSFYGWSLPIVSMLFDNLKHLVNLEHLKYYMVGQSLDKIEDFTNCLAEMKNLKSLCYVFHNDLVYPAILERIKSLIDFKVNVRGLLRYQNLRKLELDNAVMNVGGMATLVANLPKLEEVNNYDEFGAVLECLYEHYSDCSPFTLTKIQVINCTPKQMSLLVMMFPKVEHLSFIWKDEFLSQKHPYDLTVLQTLNDLKILKIENYQYRQVNELLKLVGSNIKTLSLSKLRHFGDMNFAVMFSEDGEDVTVQDDMNFTTFIDVGNYCPQLETLEICNSKLMVSDQESSHRNRDRLPFSDLKELSWRDNIMNSNAVAREVQFILTRAKDIRCVRLDSGINLSHTNVVQILSENHLEKLEELHMATSDIKMDTVDLLLESCPNLRVLSDLREWTGISRSELRQFLGRIKENNFDLELKTAATFT